MAIPGGVPLLLLPALAVLLAPVLALLFGFFILRPAAPRRTHLPILLSCAVVAACAVLIVSRVYLFGEGFDIPVAHWMVAGAWSVSFGLRVDGLSSVMLAMVAVVGGLIHLWACEYMAHDEGFSRFFLAFHLFFLSMIGLVLSNSYVELYLFWELTGLSSYLLIGHWYHKASARRAAFQAFMTNRIGDLGFFLALLILLRVFGDTRFLTLFRSLKAGAVGDPEAVTLAGWLLFWAACGKSAQFPLYFWLPDAMEGPTPVSALMHAATMVTAGIFLLVRSWPLIGGIPGLPAAIAAVGAFTALFAGVLAGTRRDLKRILAYSTVSHLGIMAFAIGLSQPACAIFHLVTHGFFKAALFLCAGNIAHALGQPSADLDQVGGLRKTMPLTFLCFALAAFSLAGIWPFAGFYSKDAILDAALAAGGWRALCGLLIGAVSAFYIFRMLFLTFFGPSPRQKGPAHFHEPGALGTVPVLFLSLGALSVGWLHNGFSTMLSRSGVPALPELSSRVTLLGSAAALAGVLLAYVLALGLPKWDWEWRERRPRLERWLAQDLGVKPAVAACAAFVRRLAGILGQGWDKNIWDRWFIEGWPPAALGLGELGQELAGGGLNDYLWWMAVAVAALLYGALRL
ncbi:MAG: NADH-quinone oxidoreductase subunit L [Elusimicrobia bacterium]|nr:NADH-quinone oxidoreductase subunit L [Elusimicrobiota bacterium]MDE2424757.1 NADH-quinone oxidoreductase subunit L [Elusimicrobiota bacterium]